MARIENDPANENRAKIKVLGIGGAGGNAVNRMVHSGLEGVEFISINTDAMALENSAAHKKISLGKELTKGLGAGAKPEVGFDAINESLVEVREALDGADMVFITAGMGGGTGTGGAPVVAQLCKEMDILSVAVVTRPFFFEGPIRAKNSVNGLKLLKESVDTIITIQNQKILSIADNNMSVKDAFAACDEVLVGAVRGISEIILKHGLIQVDFADIKTIMTCGGDALMGTGTAEGENRAMTAAQRAINSPLLDDIRIEGSSGILVNMTGGEDMGIHEINEAMSYIYSEVGEENVPNIIFGTVINPDLEGKITVTVISTGFRKDDNDKFVSQVGITGDQPSFESRVDSADPQSQPVAQPVIQQPTPSLHSAPLQPQPIAQPVVQQPAPNPESAPEAFIQPVQQIVPTMATPVAPFQDIITPSVYIQPNSLYEVQEEPVAVIASPMYDMRTVTNLASTAEKQELEIENQMSPKEHENLMIEEPTSFASERKPVTLITNLQDSFLEVKEELWVKETSHLEHPQGADVPAYLRNLESIKTEVQKAVEPIKTPTMNSIYSPQVKRVEESASSSLKDLEQPSYLRDEAIQDNQTQLIESKPSASIPSSSPNFGKDDDDFETPAFLRNHDY